MTRVPLNRAAPPRHEGCRRAAPRCTGPGLEGLHCESGRGERRKVENPEKPLTPNGALDASMRSRGRMQLRGVLHLLLHFAGRSAERSEARLRNAGERRTSSNAVGCRVCVCKTDTSHYVERVRVGA